jgi:hypothetical protein
MNEEEYPTLNKEVRMENLEEEYPTLNKPARTYRSGTGGECAMTR